MGAHVEQAGSEVSANGFRFDFTHHKGLTEKDLAKIEADVNKVIQDNYRLETKVMNADEAKKSGALAFFGEKYGHQVRVLKITKGDWDDPASCVSTELCGGTHVGMTGEIAFFNFIFNF